MDAWNIHNRELISARATLPERSETQPRVRFELTAALSKGGNATAKIRSWQNGQLITTDLEITVYDALGTAERVVGDYGYAQWCPDAQRWEIEQPAGTTATVVYFEAKQDFDETKDQVDADLVYFMGGSDPRVGGNNITWPADGIHKVYNPPLSGGARMFKGKYSYRGFAKWGTHRGNPHAPGGVGPKGAWEIFQMQCNDAKIPVIESVAPMNSTGDNTDAMIPIAAANASAASLIASGTGMMTIPIGATGLV